MGGKEGQQELLGQVRLSFVAVDTAVTARALIQNQLQKALICHLHTVLVIRCVWTKHSS